VPAEGRAAPPGACLRLLLAPVCPSTAEAPWQGKLRHRAAPCPLLRYAPPLLVEDLAAVRLWWCGIGEGLRAFSGPPPCRRPPLSP
jgi:hypothetical protein